MVLALVQMEIKSLASKDKTDSNAHEVPQHACIVATRVFTQAYYSIPRDIRIFGDGDEFLYIISTSLF